jgi:hypothetical protein
MGGITELFPATRLLGRCGDCGALVFMHHAHEWAHRETNRLCWPGQTGARLYCGTCADRRWKRRPPRSDA